MTDQTEAAGPGHNLPPEADPLEQRRQNMHDDFGERYAVLLASRDRVLEELEAIPTEIEDDETAGKVSDWIKKNAAYLKDAEAARVKEKEPYLEGGRLVDGFFAQITERLRKAKRTVQDRLTQYQRRRAEEERRRREEEARIARQKEEEERRKAEEARMAAAAAEAEAEERRKAAQKESEAEKVMSEHAEQQMAKADTAEALADQHAGDAVKAEKSARAKSADVSRTRGDFGAVASLRERWTFEITGEVDLEALRPYFREADIDHAVRAFVRQGGRKLEGVRIFPTTDSVVR